MAASGNVRYSQVRSGDKTGSGNRLVTAASGTLTQDVPLLYDASGNIVATATRSGNTTNYVTATAGAKTSGNYPQWDSNGNLTDGGAGGGGSLPWTTWTAPVDGDFAWINQGGASITARTNPTRLLLTAPAQSGNNVRIRKKAAPSTPYTVTAWFYPSLATSTTTFNANCGLLFRESSSGKLHLFALIAVNGNDWQLQSIYNNSPTSFSSTPKSLFAWSVMLTGAVGMRIADDNTSRILSVSQNGEDWVPIHTVTRTTHLTADEVGFYCEAQSSSEGSSICLVSWAEA